VTLLISRGQAMLELRDISAARLLFERAAELGSAQGATEAGKTYDPDFLRSVQARGIIASPAQAAAWYRKAAALGDTEAANRLTRMLQ
jgi:TPR repeat protein